MMKDAGGRRRKFAVVLMLGVTVVAASGVGLTATSIRPYKRFLAVDNRTRQSLLTVVTDSSTAIVDPSPLYAGLQVRVYGTVKGSTIHAQRIEVMR
jgi:hypothetical protein